MPEIRKSKNCVELRFRKGIYIEDDIDTAIGVLKSGLKTLKDNSSNFFVVKLCASESINMEKIAWDFCNLVIAAGKKGL